MKVKNVIGSSRFPKPKGYDSWLDYWIAQKGWKPAFCSTNGCYRLCAVGAHVQKVYGSDKKWYIVPLCESCNHRTDEFEVPDTYLVPVPSNL